MDNVPLEIYDHAGGTRGQHEEENGGCNLSCQSLKSSFPGTTECQESNENTRSIIPQNSDGVNCKSDLKTCSCSY